MSRFLRVLCSLVLATGTLLAGGAEAVSPEGVPYRWPAGQAIAYSIDNGPLGSFSRDEVALLLRKALERWQALPTTSVRFREEGFLAEDLQLNNYRRFFDGKVRPENPVVFDNDGRILDDLLGQGASQSVHGFGGIRYVDFETREIRSGWIILNGALASPATLERVLLHEAGHLLGLDHTQAGHDAVSQKEGAGLGELPVMYPFVLPGALAEPALDDAAWLSWLYPAPDFHRRTATLRGQVVRASGAPLAGAHVVAVPLHRGDEGEEPWQRGVVSGISGFLHQGDGSFELPGLPPGDYYLYIEPLDPRFSGISSIGQHSGKFLGFPRDYYNGSAESGSSLDDPEERARLHVGPGEFLSGLELVTNEGTIPVLFPASVEGAGELLPDTFVGVALLNSAASESGIELQGMDGLGRETFRVPYPRFLESRGQEAFLTRDAVPGDFETRTVVTRGTEGPLQGLFMIGGTDLNRADGVSGRWVASRNLFFSPVLQSSKESTILFLFNPGGQEDQVHLRLWDRAGRLRGERMLSLPPLGSELGTVEQLFRVASVEGYVQVESNAPVLGFQLAVQERGLASQTARPAAPVRELMAPHFFVDPEGGDTELELLNADTQPVTVTVEIYEDTSGPLAASQILLSPESLVRLPLSSLLERRKGESLSGFLKLILQGERTGSPRVLGSTRFTGNRGSVLASAPLVESGNRETVFLHVAQSEVLGIFMGLALLNPNPEPASVKLQVFDERGVQQEERTVLIPPLSRLADLLDGPPLFGEGFSRVKGHLRVSSSVPILTLALFGDYHSRFLTTIQGQPPLP